MSKTRKSKIDSTEVKVKKTDKVQVVENQKPPEKKRKFIGKAWGLEDDKL